MLSPTLKRLHQITLTLHFTVCLAYGGREEIVDAVKSVAVDHASGNLELVP